MSRETSTGRILKNDYASLLLLMFIGVVWIIAIGCGILGQLPQRRAAGAIEMNSTAIAALFGVAVVVTLVFGWLAARRIAKIKHIVRTGLEVPGRILAIDFFKDRGRVEFEYQYAGQSYQAGNAIWKNRETTQLQAGDEIAIIVDPSNPAKVFVASLYT